MPLNSDPLGMQHLRCSGGRHRRRGGPNRHRDIVPGGRPIRSTCTIRVTWRATSPRIRRVPSRHRLSGKSGLGSSQSNRSISNCSNLRRSARNSPDPAVSRLPAHSSQPQPSPCRLSHLADSACRCFWTEGMECGNQNQRVERTIAPWRWPGPKWKVAWVRSRYVINPTVRGSICLKDSGPPNLARSM